MTQDNPYESPTTTSRSSVPPRDRRSRLSLIWVGVIFFIGGLVASSTIDEQTSGDIRRIVQLVSGLLSLTGTVIILFSGVMGLLRLIFGNRIS